MNHAEYHCGDAKNAECLTATDLIHQIAAQKTASRYTDSFENCTHQTLCGKSNVSREMNRIPECKWNEPEALRLCHVERRCSHKWPLLRRTRRTLHLAWIQWAIPTMGSTGTNIDTIECQMQRVPLSSSWCARFFSPANPKWRKMEAHHPNSAHPSRFLAMFSSVPDHHNWNCHIRD